MEQTRECGKQRNGFTIVELLVIVCVAGVVLGLTLSVYRHAVRLSRQTACISNLRQLAQGLSAYHTQYRQLPEDDAPEEFDQAMREFLKSDSVLHCPADMRPGASSYAPYYVQRKELKSADFLLGCPRHSGGDVATIVFGNAGAEGNKLGPITRNGVPVHVGDRVTGGLLRFADGSVASLQDDFSVEIVTSFQRDDGSYYSILRVPVGEVGAIGLDVNPKSRLEVVTPAAIAGSEGTRFYVLVCDAGEVKTDDGNIEVAKHVILYVRDGRVRVGGKGRKKRSRLVVPSKAIFVEHPSGTLMDCVPPSKDQLPLLPGDEKWRFYEGDDDG